jgi:hypothetical protein
MRQTRIGNRFGDRLRRGLALVDPGGLRARQAGRTLLAVGLILVLFRHARLDTRLFAGLGTGLFMQCAEGAGWRVRSLTQIVCGWAMTAAAAAGTWLAGTEPWEWVLLTAVAFLAFALRRFVPRRAPVPLFGFVLCLLGTVLPGGPSALGPRVVALGTGLVLAVGVYSLVLPPDRRRTFFRVRGQSRAEAARALRAADADRPDWDAALDRLLAFEQGLADSLDEIDRALADRPLADLYEMHQSLTLFRELRARVRAGPDDELSAAVDRLADDLAAAFERSPDDGTRLAWRLAEAEALVRAAPPDGRTAAAAAALFSARRLAAVEGVTP